MRDLIRRVSRQARKEANVHHSMDWPQVRQALKDHFEKARRPLKRYVWRVLEARREPRESEGAFARRLANAAKDLRRRLVEGQYANYKGRWEAYEESVMDVL